MTFIHEPPRAGDTSQRSPCHFNFNYTCVYSFIIQSCFVLFSLFSGALAVVPSCSNLCFHALEAFDVLPPLKWLFRGRVSQEKKKRITPPRLISHPSSLRLSSPCDPPPVARCLILTARGLNAPCWSAAFMQITHTNKWFLLFCQQDELKKAS